MSDIPVVDLTPKHNSGKIDAAWWQTEKSEDLSASVFAVCEQIINNLRYRRLDNLRYARLYANKDYDDYLNQVVYDYLGQKMSLNVCKSVTNTVSSRIAKDTPRPLFLTENGDFSLQKRAKKLTQYIEGLFYQNKVYQKGPLAFRDACVWGTGVVHSYIDTQRKTVCCERVMIDELLVDETEARYGDPRQIHRVKSIDAEVLKTLFPKSKDFIESAKRAYAGSTRTVADKILVIESWHLRSGPEAKDGLHCIAISNTQLLREAYEHDWLPFDFFRWEDPLVGFYGEPLVGEIVGIQLEINTIVQRIKEAMELISVPRIFVDRASDVNLDHITDEVGAIIQYSGSKPEFFVAQAQHPEVYAYLEYLVRKAYEIPGVSQLSANAKKPVGLDSRASLREYQDIESERFSLAAKRYQQFYLDIAETQIKLSRICYTQNKGLAVKVKGGKFIETIKWNQVDLEDDQYSMKVYPTNLLPSTPEGKLQKVEELMNSGLIDKDVGLSLLDFPDVEAYTSLYTAAVDDIKRVIDDIQEDGKYQPPEPFMNLQLGLKMMQNAYLRGKSNNVPEARLDLMRRWIKQAMDILVPPQDMQAISPMAQPPIGPGALPPTGGASPLPMPPMPGPMMPPEGALPPGMPPV